MLSHSGNQMIDPYLLFEKAQLQPKMHIADFGCGRTGHILFPASKIVGELGIGYGIDIQKDVLESVQKMANLENLHNISTVWSNLEIVGKTAIPENSLDVVFMINVLIHSDNRHAILEEAFRLLKEKGRIIVVDWQENNLPIAPLGRRLVDFQDIINWSKMRGVFLQEEFSVGPYHRGGVLYKHV